VNYVVEPEELLEKATAYARDLARKSPVALQGTKTAMQSEEGMLPVGLEAAYHSLLAQACRVGGEYRKRVDEFLGRGETR
jgi:enoyl-CoA hydratase/carnithine racemase